MAAAVVVAVSLKAAMICVGVALVSPMYAFEGGSEYVAVGIAAVAGTAAIAFLSGGFVTAWAILTVDLGTAMSRFRAVTRRRSSNGHDPEQPR